MRDSILRASVATVVEAGVDSWTVDRVASKAGAAKGLVNYHFRSKANLIAITATTIGETRRARRIQSLVGRQGPAALDALWDSLVSDVASGWFRAWLSLAAQARPEAPSSPGGSPEGADLRAALAQALDFPPQQLPATPALLAMLDGLELQLLLGSPPAEVKDAYHRLWLGLLGA
jgi:AcrR family transcriptional regulator